MSTGYDISDRYRVSVKRFTTPIVPSLAESNEDDENIEHRTSTLNIEPGIDCFPHRDLFQRQLRFVSDLIRVGRQKKETLQPCAELGEQKGSKTRPVLGDWFR